MDPADLSAVVSYPLIASNKCPGIKPINVSKTVWHIIAKTVLSVHKENNWKAHCNFVLASCQQLFTLHRYFLINQKSGLHRSLMQPIHLIPLLGRLPSMILASLSNYLD